MASTDSTSLPNPVSQTDTSDDAKLKSNSKKELFDKEFRSLIKQAEDTITARYGMSVDFGNDIPELICLRRYLAIYNNTCPTEHYQYFETIYNRKRSEILNCLKDDRWIRTGNLVIQFGEGIKATDEIEEKRKSVRIMLSDIFLIACDLQLQAEKALVGIDESFAQAAGGKDLIRPNILLLHLLRIFYHLNDGSDKPAIGAIVTQLETDLGVKTKTVESTPFQVPVPDASSAATVSLFTMATSMMEKMGYKPPPDMKPPSETEISSVISTVFNNQTTQSAIQGMFSSLQGCTDFGSALQEVVKNVSDPKTMQAIQGSVLETARLTGIDTSTNLTQFTPVATPPSDSSS